ncbi:MAG: amidohydrolase family protein [Gemmatales bacterium]|nr:amidohydrolase family protein [Gemmatales bacterium]MDW8387761.1 amidohydrolase family protein [Gemmatales bacterium]
MRSDRPILGLAFLMMMASLLVAEENKDSQSAKPTSPPIAIVGGDVYTVSHGVIPRGTVLIQDGKIAAVGKDVAIPENALRIEAAGKCVTPGFVAISASNVGIRTGTGARGRTGEPAPPQGVTGRVVDAINPYDRNILFCLASGITTACVEVSGGGTGRFGRDALDLEELDETNVCPCCGMTYLPLEPITAPNPTERTPRRHAVLRMTFGELDRMLVKESPFYHLPAGAFAGAFNKHQWRETIKRAKEQVRDRNEGEDEGGFGGFGGGFGRRVPEEVVQLVEKKIPLRTDAASVEQIRTALALAKELGYAVILEGVHEAWLIPEELKEAQAQVILTPRSRRRPQLGKEDSTGSSIETAGILERTGVPFAVATLGNSVNLDGIPGRDLTSLMLEAAFAVRGGCSDDTALAAITINPARMLGLDKRIGSIEIGKDADLLILTGPPLDYHSHVDKALVGGKVYYDRVRENIYPDLPNRPKSTTQTKR